MFSLGIPRYEFLKELVTNLLRVLRIRDSGLGNGSGQPRRPIPKPSWPMTQTLPGNTWCRQPRFTRPFVDLNVTSCEVGWHDTQDQSIDSLAARASTLPGRVLARSNTVSRRHPALMGGSEGCGKANMGSSYARSNR